MNDISTPTPDAFGMEPDDLDGYTIEQLSDYLDSGRTPVNPEIESSPGCRIALDALWRLRQLSPELLAADTRAEPEADESWVQSILSGITLDARAGRRIPIPSPEVGADLGITEGAVRGMVRAAESDVAGVLIGRVRIDGDPTEPGQPATVCAEVSVAHGREIPSAVDHLRAAIASRLADHALLNLSGIDIVVHDLHGVPSSLGGRRGDGIGTESEEH
ncbi:hypothetical protein PQI23_05430 [Leucobacter sp. USCH14]|uniref:hypothetical protein n=1 Tax=Leucobacter sp. USCH14 TaxID=3024838 RepID=UPI00309DB663